MRTIALFAMTGIIAAAQTPKPAPAPATPARLITAEIITLNTIDARMKALRDEHAELDKQRTLVKQEACQRALSVTSCDIKTDGTIVKIEPPKAPAKPEVKK